MKKTKKFQRTKEDFTCENCGENIIGSGYTNHCPKCLYSKHVDIAPGDRLNDCGGLMKPIAALYSHGGYAIQQQCENCGEKGKVKANQQDNTDELIKLTREVMYE